MGDSDEDVDYKRRDKFRTERRGYDGPGDRGSSPPPGGGRRDWRGSDSRPSMNSYSSSSRDRGGGGGRSSYDGYRRDRYSPARGGGGRHDMSPPYKRMRGPDWDDRGYYDSHYDREDYVPPRGPASRGYMGGLPGRGGGVGGLHGGGGDRGISSSGDADVVQPPMMTFKAFLATQDDSISDEEAIKKYAEYKLEFRRQQLNEFFVNHKDEEWFKLKYHPEDSLKRKEEQKSNLMKRIDVFQKFNEQGKFVGENSLDGDKSEFLVKLLDSVVILLEGGDENDLKILDKTEEEMKKAAEAAAEEAEEKKTEEGNDEEKKDEENKVESKDEEEENKEAKDDGEDGESKSKDGEEEDELAKKAKELLAGEAKPSSRKRKRTKEYDDESSGSSSSENEDEELPPGMTKEEKAKESENGVNKEEEETTKESEKENEVEKEEENQEEVQNGKMEHDEEDGEEKRRPRALHKTASIFLRNLAPTITKQEVEAMCKRYPGFLRAAIADPQPERRWFRRGWVTFERDVKIKEICFNLNNIRLRECELGPIVNRDLSRRIRTVNGITVDKKIVRNDIKIAAKVITNLDKKWNLWGDPDKKDSEADILGLASNNPILKNITDYLIEEASAEEEELLGKNNDLEDGEEGEEGNSIVRDEELIKVLDKLLFYLRIVHSVDFYNHSEYPNEDEMPNRCGIMHARGIPPTSNVTQAEIDEYCSNFEKKMGSFIVPKSELTDEEASKLGMKNEDDEVEKFVQANTQELGKDKWLCPLSGKKFKGPDYIRKHIFNKHSEKVEEVKKEVKYYNNYLKDPKRPQLPENPQNKARSGSASSRDSPRLGPTADPYHYSGQPREATSYPVYDDRRDYGGRDRYGGGSDRGFRGGGGRPRPEPYGIRGRIRDRVGSHPVGGARYLEKDPRGVIDYSDVDFNHDIDYF